MPDGPIVCDTGPLIGLSLVDQLHLLPRLFDSVVVPRAVHSEIMAGGGDRPGTRAILDTDWLAIVDGAQPDPLLAAELGAGEAAVIATAFRTEARLALLDERKARRVALRAYGLDVRGSAGVLVAAKRAGLVTEVRPLLLAMIDNGYHLSNRLLDHASAAAGEA